MLGNNSGGSHSIAYGLTVEHVIELTGFLADGSRVIFGTVTPAEFAAKTRLETLEGQIYREIARIRDPYRDEIARRYRGHWRRVCGYNLNELIKDGPLNMARLVVGSEGTLFTIVEAKMRLVKRPKKTAARRHPLPRHPGGARVLAGHPRDRPLRRRADRQDDPRPRPCQHRAGERMGFVSGDPAAILIVEYTGDTDAEVKDKVEKLEALRARERFGYAGHIALDAAEQQSIWKLRKAGLGLLLGTRGDAKPIAFIEDTAVDPKHMPAFVPRFRDIMAKHGAEGAYYGHCSVGCLHIRPLINLKTQRGLDQVQAMAAEIFDMVLEFEGAISSEHGDGRARSPYLERVFGSTFFGAFRRAQARLRSEEPPQPRQHRGEPRRHRAHALRRPVPHLGAEDAPGLLRAGRLRRRRGDVQRGRRVPEEPRGDHVPVLHGDPRRGALDPGARQRAARGALGAGAPRGLHRQAACSR